MHALGTQERSECGNATLRRNAAVFRLYFAMYLGSGGGRPDSRACNSDEQPECLTLRPELVPPDALQPARSCTETEAGWNSHPAHVRAPRLGQPGLWLRDFVNCVGARLHS